MTLSPGTLIDERFQIIEEVGKGGFGTVYRAQHIQLGRVVALKVLNTSLLADPEKLARFKREGHLISVLDHPNILRVLAAGVISGSEPYIAMEFLEGKQLSDVLEEKGPMPWRELLPLMIEVCSALSYSHGEEIIHRDIKPSNIMLETGSDGKAHAKLVDFGIAKSISESAPKLTQTDMVFGSVYYMSPSDFDGAPASPQTDIYALGITMYEMLTGSPPFVGTTVFSTMAKHSRDAVPAINSQKPAAPIPDDLQRLIEWMLAKEPEQRVSSVQVVKENLEAILAGLPTSIPFAEKRLTIGINKPTILMGGFSILFGAAIVIGVVLFFTQQNQPRQEPIHYLLAGTADAADERDRVAKVNVEGATNHYPWLHLAELYKGRDHPMPSVLLHDEAIARCSDPDQLKTLQSSKAGTLLLMDGCDQARPIYVAQAPEDEDFGKDGGTIYKGLFLCDFQSNDLKAARTRADVICDRIIIDRDHRYVGEKKPDLSANLLILQVAEVFLRNGDAQKGLKAASGGVELCTKTKYLLPPAQAMEMVAQALNGKPMTQSGIDAFFRDVPADPLTRGSLEIVLAWGLSKSDSSGGASLCLEGMDKILGSKPPDLVLYLRNLDDALRASSYVAEFASPTDKAKIVAKRAELTKTRAGVMAELKAEKPPKLTPVAGG